MEYYKERLKVEDEELVDKLTKLENFMGTRNFYDLDRQQRLLMTIQLNSMRTYQLVLGMRRELLNKN